MVNDVQKSSPAAQAGIQSGDIIVTFEADTRPATLTILREVERKQLRVTPLPKED
jgi:S1-C subfamily serine protease